MTVMSQLEANTSIHVSHNIVPTQLPVAEMLRIVLVLLGPDAI
jgi:hypothetical protein